MEGKENPDRKKVIAFLEKEEYELEFSEEEETMFNGLHLFEKYVNKENTVAVTVATYLPDKEEK